MSGQLESHHFFRSGDIVRHVDGQLGTIVDAYALYARVAWQLGGEEEIDQFDPRVIVVERAGAGG